MPSASMSNETSICGVPRGAGGMPTRSKLAQRFIFGGHLALALQHLDLDLGLVIGRRTERLGFFGGDGRVPVDKSSEHPT